jgi:hypothetical protein
MLCLVFIQVFKPCLFHSKLESMDPHSGTGLNATTAENAMESIKSMIITRFTDQEDFLSVPLKGTLVCVNVKRGKEIESSGFVDEVAADVYSTTSSFIEFIPKAGKMTFSVVIDTEEKAVLFEKELLNLLLCQRAHNVAWSLW